MSLDCPVANNNDSLLYTVSATLPAPQDKLRHRSTSRHLRILQPFLRSLNEQAMCVIALGVVPPPCYSGALIHPRLHMYVPLHQTALYFSRVDHNSIFSMNQFLVGNARVGSYYSGE